MKTRGAEGAEGGCMTGIPPGNTRTRINNAYLLQRRSTLFSTCLLVALLISIGFYGTSVNNVVAAGSAGQDLTYSTFFGGGAIAAGITVDDYGAAYITGMTESNDVFVAKFTPNGGGSGDLDWSYEIGGSGVDCGIEVAADVSGNVWIIGFSQSVDFPISPNSFGGGDQGIFILKLDGGGNLLYSDIVGYGAGMSEPHNLDIAIDDEYLYLFGDTSDANFFDFWGAGPITPFHGGKDAFVVKLRQTDSGFEWGTFVGGSGNENGFGIAVDLNGFVSITGGTDSTDLLGNGINGMPLTGSNDCYVARLDPAGNVVFSTYLGGNEAGGASGPEFGAGIAADYYGNIYVTGRTSGPNFPTSTDAFDPDHNGNTDAFLTVLDPAQPGSASILYSTYLGGSGSERGDSVDVDSNGNAYVYGRTWSDPFPTRDALYGYKAKQDLFVAKLDPGLSGANSLVSSTYFGGRGGDHDGGLAFSDASGSGRVYLTGWTDSGRGFDTTDGAYDESFNGGQSDAFLSILEFREVAQPTSVHVDSILLTTVSAGQGKKRGRAEVAIFDDQGSPVAGASVTGAFSGDFSDTGVSAITNSSGVAVFTTSSAIKGTVSFSFCVTDVTAGLPYVPGDNGESCDSL